MAEPQTTWDERSLAFNIDGHWVRVATSAGVLVGHISPVVRTPHARHRTWDGEEFDLREPGTNHLAWGAMARFWMQRLEREVSRSRRPSKWLQ